MDSSHCNIDELYRRDSRKVLATLIRLLQGNFDLAEEAMQDAFAAAVVQWPNEGVPSNPVAWLVTAGRFKAIDRIRKRSRQDALMHELAVSLESEAVFAPEQDSIEDDRLRLIFTCCHPSLAQEAQLTLTLREVCGLTTEQIASAFLIPVPTLAQRIVRAKTKIREAAIPYEVPELDQLHSRLSSVLQVIYLVFNEGYCASAGNHLARRELSLEAIRLGRLLTMLLPEPEVESLLALMLLHDARHEARITSAGDLIPLEEQNRQLWNRPQINEGCAIVLRVLQDSRAGPYALQAAIAAVHAESKCASETDWRQIIGLYDMLLRLAPSPVVALNRAVAFAMQFGPQEGIRLILELVDRGELARYHLAYAALADLYRRLGNRSHAAGYYRTAIELAEQEPEKRYLQQCLERLYEKS